MKEITKEEILGALVGRFFDDLNFIEAINNLTYGRKVQLKQLQKTNQTDNGQVSDDKHINVGR